VAANSKTSGKTAPDGGVGPQTFRSVTAIVLWWVWVLFAVGNLIDLAVQGRDHLALVAAAVLLAVTGVAYVTAERPRVISADDGITVQNPLRDHHVPWPLVRKVDIADLLRVHVRDSSVPDTEMDTKSKKVISAWAVHYSRRRQLTSDMRTRRASARAARGGGMTPFGMPTTFGASHPAAPPTSQEAEAERIARMLNDRATAAGIEQATLSGQVETDAGQGSPGAARMVSTWSWQALAAVGIPALLLLIVVLA
jgi:hypothetical protein